MNTTKTNASITPLIAMDEVESSQVSMIGHHPELNVLRVQFAPNRNGIASVYDYENFAEDDFAKFKAAESIGSYFGAFIKNDPVKYPFKKVASINTTTGELV